MKVLILLAVFWQVLNISAYCETGQPTSSGKWPTAGFTCAADHLPFGTRVTLPDGRVWVVEDVFGGGYVDKLDLFLDSEDACWKWGRRRLRCKIETPLGKRMRKSYGRPGRSLSKSRRRNENEVYFSEDFKTAGGGAD